MNRNRSGSMLIEATMAVMLLGLALIGIAQLLVTVGQQQRTLEYKRLATLEAGNLLERIMARPWSEIAANNLDDVTLSPELKSRLPGARLMLEVTQLDETPAARQVQVQIEWSNIAGQLEQVELVAWKHAVEQ